MSEVKTENKSPKTIKRYRLARPGDEGRECWVSNDGLHDALNCYPFAQVFQGMAKKWFLSGQTIDDLPSAWVYAYVADEAPDPSEGYRLLKKLEYDGEEEAVEKGDEYWNAGWQKVNLHCLYGGRQTIDMHYRRRIEQEKWTPKVGDWVIAKTKMYDGTIFETQPSLVHAIQNEGCLACGIWWKFSECSPAEPPAPEPENDLAKQVEFAKAEFASWPQWKKDLAVSVLSPKAESETPREPIRESQQQTYIVQVWDGGKCVQEYKTTDNTTICIVPVR